MTGGLVDAAESAAAPAEMSSFYAAGLVFIPARPYTGFVDSLEYVTVYFHETVIETVENATGNAVNTTEAVAEEVGLETAINAGVNVISTGVNTISIPSLPRMAVNRSQARQN
ncbi:unnamed protein product [Prorocentrum cordatum]|uniref:Subtilisin n=1 Tax=Prorocentrum cordatum TaxID=2364126 RepID=A0ABN9Q3E0_9DINO|nr:unnamed protein product [Polarella glacialis]